MNPRIGEKLQASTDSRGGIVFRRINAVKLE
jgi:hypothetical protein